MLGAAVVVPGFLSLLFSAAAAAVTPPIQLQPVAVLDSPLYVTHANDARLFIVQRDGRIRISTPSQGLLPGSFLDLTALVDDSGNGGMFTMAFHPDYPTTPYFFVSYTETGSPLESVVARYEVSAGDPNVADAGSASVLLRYAQPAASHNNGQIAFGPDGFLYIGSGDGGELGDPNCRSQQGDEFQGKILRVDVDQNVGSSPFYGIPSTNPYEDPGDGVLDEIWARGFRNPWRFSFDQSGNLWIGDVGQDTREEIDRQPASSGGGENYAWSVMEGTTCFSDPVDPDCPSGTPACFDSSYTDPVFEYDTGSNCAITGGHVYRGDAIPDLRGLYVFGDVCSNLIWALDPISLTRELIADGSDLAILFFGLTSFGEDVDGELYATIENGVYKLVPGVNVPALGPPGLALLALAVLASVAIWRRP